MLPHTPFRCQGCGVHTGLPLWWAHGRAIEVHGSLEIHGDGWFTRHFHAPSPCAACGSSYVLVTWRHVAKLAS